VDAFTAVAVPIASQDGRHAANQQEHSKHCREQSRLPTLYPKQHGFLSSNNDYLGISNHFEVPGF
jgi:hypothetical protein